MLTRAQSDHHKCLRHTLDLAESSSAAMQRSFPTGLAGVRSEAHPLVAAKTRNPDVESSWSQECCVPAGAPWSVCLSKNT
eukprot:416316-Rhodomonas_salina.3